MLAFDDELWTRLRCGRRRVTDVRPLLRRLESSGGDNATWSDVWDTLHHQDDVDTAAYAAVPHLIRIHPSLSPPTWNTFALVVVVELARDREQNPPVPHGLLPAYDEAWTKVVPMALRDLEAARDPLLTRSALSAIALARGLRRHAEALLMPDDELDEMVAEYLSSPPS